MSRQIALVIVVIAIAVYVEAQFADPTGAGLGANGLNGAGYLGGLNSAYGGIGAYGIQGIVAQLRALGPYGNVLANQLISSQGGLLGQNAYLGAGNGLAGRGLGLGFKK